MNLKPFQAISGNLKPFHSIYKPIKSEIPKFLHISQRPNKTPQERLIQD